MTRTSLKSNISKKYSLIMLGRKRFQFVNLTLVQWSRRHASTQFIGIPNNQWSGSFPQEIRLWRDGTRNRRLPLLNINWHQFNCCNSKDLISSEARRHSLCSNTFMRHCTSLIQPPRAETFGKNDGISYIRLMKPCDLSVSLKGLLTRTFSAVFK